MLAFYTVLDIPLNTWDTTVSLPFDRRIKSRLKVTLDNGEQAGLFLPRGSILRHGQGLQSPCGRVVKILSAIEPVATVYSDDSLCLIRLAYHLGNRHVCLEITATYVRYQPDHVLDDMVVTLGGVVTHEHKPFEPEAGAYHPHSH